MQDETGVYIEPEVTEWLMIVHAIHGVNAKWAFNPSNLLQSQSSNQYSGLNVRVVSTPRLGTGNKVYLFNISATALKPVHLAEYTKPFQEQGTKNVQTQRYPVVTYGEYEAVPGAYQGAAVITLSN